MAILSFDLVIFAVIMFLYIKIKHSKPDIFFIPKNTIVFLPPEEKDIKDLRKEQEKYSKQTKGVFKNKHTYLKNKIKKKIQEKTITSSQIYTRQLQFFLQQRLYERIRIGSNAFYLSSWPLYNL